MEESEYTLVARKPYFGLPTACPSCLPVYIYLKFAGFSFRLDLNSSFPDSDQIPYVESGTYVAYNNESGGVINRLKEDGIVDLDAAFDSIPEWVSTKALIASWLDDALMYELWLGSDGRSARSIYYSDLPWLIGKALFLKQVHVVKQHLGITKENAERKGDEIYRRAKVAYAALSTRLGEQDFLFEDRPSSLDALFLGHVLITLEALPETSALRTALSEQGNIIRYAEKLRTRMLETGPSEAPRVHSMPSSSTASSSHSSSKSKRKPKREMTEEEKTFRRRAKYFLITQLVAVLIFLSVMSGDGYSDVDFDDDDESFD